MKCHGYRALPRRDAHQRSLRPSDQCPRAGFGYATTMNTGNVAYIIIEAALRGDPVVIPGIINHLIQAVSTLIPTMIKIRLIFDRWTAVRQKGIAQGYLRGC